MLAPHSYCPWPHHSASAAQMADGRHRSENLDVDPAGADEGPERGHDGIDLTATDLGEGEVLPGEPLAGSRKRAWPSGGER